MIGLAPWNYIHLIENIILVIIKPKRDTRLQKNRAELDFFATVVKIPAFYHFFGLKRVKFLPFDIKHLIINIKS